jgi:5-(carboxyamino)imidazole ribonucleotide synthase
LYGKLEPRPGRKMGHYCLLGETVEKALNEALEIRQHLIDEK